MLPTRTARAVLPTHRPGSRSTPAPAPRARTGRTHTPAHAVHTASAPHWPAPAHPPQRARRKASMALRHRLIDYVFDYVLREELRS